MAVPEEWEGGQGRGGEGRGGEGRGGQRRGGQGREGEGRGRDACKHISGHGVSERIQIRILGMLWSDPLGI